MAKGRLRQVLGHLARRLPPGAVAGLTDSQLLERFLATRDEAAFEALLGRHGPMVLGVCRRVLRHAQDAEDAFQATFLTLVRKGGSIGKRQALGGWLFRVAQRTALRARARREKRPMTADDLRDVPGPVGPPGAPAGELGRALQEEVGRLPAACRDAFILCCLEGRTDAEAARELGCPRGTVHSRLFHARRRLRQRLAARGITLAGAAAALLVPPGAAAALPRPLLLSTLSVATAFAAEGPAAAGVPAAALGLSREVCRGMFLKRALLAAALALAGAALVGGEAVGWRWAFRAAARDPGGGAPEQAASPARPEPPEAVPPPEPADPGQKEPERPAVFKAEPKPVPILGRTAVLLPADGIEKTAATERVLRTDKEVEQLAGAAGVGYLAGLLKVPAIDLRKHLLVHVAFGPLSSGAGRVTVTRVVGDGKVLTVCWKYEPPEPDQPVTGVLSHPNELVLLERFEGEVRFVHEDGPGKEWVERSKGR